MFVDVRIILTALWVAVAFCFASGAVLGLFKPGYIQGLIEGEIDGIKVTQNVLIGNAVLMVAPAVLGFLSLAMSYPMIRWVNLIVCFVYVVQILMAYAYYITYKIQTWRYYNVLKVTEVILYALIVWYNWNWV